MARRSRVVPLAKHVLVVLALSIVIGTRLIRAGEDRGLRTRNDLLHGEIYADGIEYFDFFVDEDVVAVSVSVARMQGDGAACEGSCDSKLELFLRHGSFPTQAIHDQRVTATRTERGDLVVEQLRTGRYFLLLRGGQLFESLPTFAGARAQLQYSLNVSFSSCGKLVRLDNNTEDQSSGCAAVANTLAIAPPHTSADDSLFPDQYFKPASHMLSGCVDTLRPTLRYTFRVEEPQWDLLMTLSTTFAAGFRITAFTGVHALTDIPTSDVLNSTGLMQSITILPGAGFRSVTMGFSAPPTGRWTVVISGNLTNNSTCVENGGATFAFEASHANRNCSKSDAGSSNTYSEVSTRDGVDVCSLTMTTLIERREVAQEVDELLNSAFTSEQPIVQDYNASDPFAVVYTTVVDLRLAGANIELQVESSTTFSDFQVLVRVGALPTLGQFDYRFRTKEALSVKPVSAKLNISTNASLDMQAFVWEPILFPKIGTWFLLLVSDEPSSGLPVGESVKVAVNASLHTFACPSQDEDACSSHGNCHVTLSSNGRSFSSCRCKYGYAGEQCDSVSVDRTYRGTQIFFTMISNLAVLPVMWLCARRQLFAETIMFAATSTISTLYHACDFDLFCALHYSDLRHMDFALSFNILAILIVHLSGARNHLKAGLQVFYLLSMILLTTSDNATSSVAWIVLGGVSVIQFAMAIAYYVIVGSARMGLGKAIALRAFLFHSKNFDRRYGIAGVVFLAGALSCWFLASSSNYWIIHSLWHIFSMLAVFCLIGLRLNDRYQLITPDFSIDVLATPPQFRFAVSSVKSVDILEDTSDSGYGHRRAWGR